MVSHKAIKRKLAKKRGELEQENPKKTANINKKFNKKSVKSKKTKKGLLSKLIDFTVDVSKKTDYKYKFLFTNPFEEIEKAKERYDKGNLTPEEFEDIKRLNIKILNQKLTDENFHKKLKIAKSLLDKNTLNKENYDEIKNFFISNFLNDKALKDEDPLFLIKNFKSLWDKNILDRVDYEKIKRKCINNFNSKILSVLDYLNELNNLKKLEKLEAITTNEYIEMKNTFVSELINDEISIDEDPLFLIEKAKSLLNENVISKEDYDKIKRKCIQKINSEFSPHLFEDLSMLKSLEKIEAVTKSEYIKIQDTFINKFLNNKIHENPLFLIEKVKSLLDESIINKADYEKIKRKCIDELNTKYFSLLDVFEELNKLKDLKKLKAIKNSEYNEIKSIFISKFLNNEFVLDKDPLISIKKAKALLDEKVLNEEEYGKIKKKCVAEILKNKDRSKEPMEIIKRAKKLRNENALDEGDYEKIKCVIKLYSKKSSTLNNFKELNRLKDLEKLETIKTRDYEEIKDIFISKFLNDSTKNKDSSLTIIKEAKRLNDANVLNKGEYQKIKIEYITEPHSKVFLTLNSFQELNELKDLEKLEAITTNEYNEIKSIFISKFLNNEFVLDKDPLISIKKAKALLDEKVLNEEEYGKIKKMILTKLNSKVGVDHFEKIKKTNKLLDKNIINKEDYEDIKKNSLNKLSSKDMSSLNLDEEIKKLTEIKDIGAIGQKEYQELGKLYYNEDIRRMEKINEFTNKINQSRINNDYKSVINYCNKILEVNIQGDFNTIFALHEKAVALSNLGEYNGAMRCVNRILEVDPNNQEALKTKGEYFEKLGDYKRALYYYNKSAEIGLKNKEELINGFFKEFNNNSIFPYGTGGQRLFFDYELPLYNKGRVCEILGDFEEALRCIEEILFVDPYFKCNSKLRGAELMDHLIGDNKKLRMRPCPKCGMLNHFNDILCRHCSEILKDKNRFKFVAKLISSDEYRLINNFVNYYGKNYDSEDLENLKIIINKKGFKLTIDDINWMIHREISAQEFNEFRSRIIYNNPNTLEEYVDNFLEAYGEGESYLQFFISLMKEKGFTTSESGLEIFSIVNEKKKAKKFDEFERKLLKRNNNNLRVLTLENLDSLDGYQFERFLRILFKKMGYVVKETPLSKDQGADLIINKFGHKTAVQAKRWNEKVTNKAVQEITAAIKHYNVDEGMVITNSEFTSSAIELANSNSITLIDRRKLEELIGKYPITKKEF